jgi:hypothetical protein
MHHFLSKFFQFGWAFFYRFTLTFLRLLSSRILQTDEISDIIDYIKSPMINRSFSHLSHQTKETNDSVSQYSLLGSIGKFFIRGQSGEEVDSIKELLGLTFE